jgi:hypothetical protein
MAQQQDELAVDDLRYEWPENVLGYEVRYWGGLTLTDMIAGLLPFVLTMMLLPASVLGLVVGAVAGLAGLVSVKKFDRFGRRSVITYAFARIAHARSAQSVELPIIIPRSGFEEVSVRTWGGEQLLSMGSGEGS